MANTFQFKVCTPNGEVVNKLTNELILETYNGQITLLPAHTNYTTILGSGILQFKNEDDEIEKIVVTGGFINFTNDSVIILTDSVDFKDEVPQDALELRIKELETELDKVDFNKPEANYFVEQLKRCNAIKEL